MYKKNISSKDILDLYNLGFNSVEIAKKLLVSPVSIRYHFKKLNIPAQNRSEAARKYDIDHNYFETIDTQDKAYILGLLAADGCNYISEKETKVILELTDQDIINNISNIIQPSKKAIIKPFRYLIQDNKIINAKSTYRLVLQSKKISNDLINLGVSPKKSLNLKFPEIKEDLINHFIRGFFDGDGGVYSYKNKINISFVGGESFLKELQNVLIKHLNISKTKITKNSKSNAYYFSFSAKDDIIKFYNWIYKDAILYINRKKEKIKYEV